MATRAELAARRARLKALLPGTAAELKHKMGCYGAGYPGDQVLHNDLAAVGASNDHRVVPTWAMKWEDLG